MPKVKAHIVFKDGTVGKPASRSRMLAKVQKAAKLSDVNEKRFEDFGVLTGTVEESKVADLRKVPGVASVEVDQERDLQ